MLKRTIDLLGSLMVLLMLSPLLLLLALLVRLRLGSPVFFCQQRAGLHGKPFALIKFRSMTDERDAQGNLLADAERLPPFGQWLRSTSLDELPELWNILRGEMSLVGPRPLLLRYLPRYNARQARRHEVRPGLTGWAQVNGRNASTWQERLEQDVWYVEHRSFRLDLLILWRTLKIVILREGISAEGEATMGEFLGETPAEHCPKPDLQPPQKP